MDEKELENWDINNVISWLKQINMSEYIDLFVKHNINGNALVLIKENELKERLLKDKPIGDGIQLWGYIQNLKPKYPYRYNIEKRTRKLWTKSEEMKLKKLHNQGKKLNDIATQLHRTSGAIQTRLRLLKTQNSDNIINANNNDKRKRRKESNHERSKKKRKLNNDNDNKMDIKDNLDSNPYTFKTDNVNAAPKKKKAKAQQKYLEKLYQKNRNENYSGTIVQLNPKKTDGYIEFEFDNILYRIRFNPKKANNIRKSMNVNDSIQFNIKKSEKWRNFGAINIIHNSNNNDDSIKSDSDINDIIKSEPEYP